MGITEDITQRRTGGMAAQGQQGGQQATKQAQTVGDAVAPLLEWEQSNLELWLQFLQLVVLVMIYREVS